MSVERDVLNAYKYHFRNYVDMGYARDVHSLLYKNEIAKIVVSNYIEEQLKEFIMNSKTNKYLSMVRDFRKAVNLPLDSGPDCDFKTHKAVTLEELEEMADGATDSIVTLAGIALDADVKTSSMAIAAIDNIVEAMEKAGLIPDACMNIVQAANMSKLCKLDEVQPTIDKYNQIGVECDEVEVADGLYAIYCVKTATGKDGKFYPAMKLLKCINWHEPGWSNIEEWMQPELLKLFK